MWRSTQRASHDRSSWTRPKTSLNSRHSPLRSRFGCKSVSTVAASTDPARATRSKPARPWFCCVTGEARRSSKPCLVRCCGTAAHSPGRPDPVPPANLGSWLAGSRCETACPIAGAARGTDARRWARRPTDRHRDSRPNQTSNAELRALRLQRWSPACWLRAACPRPDSTPLTCSR